MLKLCSSLIAKTVSLCHFPKFCVLLHQIVAMKSYLRWQLFGTILLLYRTNAKNKFRKQSFFKKNYSEKIKWRTSRERGRRVLWWQSWQWKKQGGVEERVAVISRDTIDASEGWWGIWHALDLGLPPSSHERLLWDRESRSANNNPTSLKIAKIACLCEDVEI